MNKFYLSILLVLFGSNFCLAQVDSIPIQDLKVEEISELEDFLESKETDENFDFNTLFEDLEYLQKRPINLNKASREELIETGLFSDIQIAALVKYKEEKGDLLAIYELQAVPFFSLYFIKGILPYVDVKSDLDVINVPFKQMIFNGKNAVYVRMSTVLEDQIGFTNEKDPERSDYYLGDQFKTYIRYKYNFENRLSYGITAETDAGEEFFTGSNSRGLDYYSAHFYVKNLNSKIKTLALGDYTICLGQGLILHSGFGRGKSSETINLKKSRRVLKQYTSVDENLFNRGAGINVALTKRIDFSLFASKLNRDANLLLSDTLSSEEQESRFTSLQSTGFHRTPNEIVDEDAIGLTAFGGNINYKHQNIKIGLNALYSSFNSDFERQINPYNQFSFNSNKLLNASIDYSAVIKNFHFFGETAISDNGAVATLNSLVIGLDRSVFVALSHRDYSTKYQALFPNAFGESSNANNERGVYLGVQIQPNYNWKLNAYMDFWKNPWLRFSVDSPSDGNEYLVRLSYKKKRKLDAYIQYRYEKKQVNAPSNETKTNFLVDRNRQNLRVHLSHKLTKYLELRNRIEIIRFDQELKERSNGFLIYQDISYRLSNFPLSLTARVAYFDTDSYDSRAYAFENDLLFIFSIPTYYNRGTRYYINLRYRGIRKLTTEFRIARTNWTNQNTIGSGLNLIQAPHRTEVKVQLKYSF